jgi:NTE family protein
MAQKRLALTFSGGGVKSAIYLGIIKALEAEGIEISYVGGLSGGALVTAAYAAGLGIEQLVEFIHNFALWKAFDTNPFDGVEIIDHQKFRILIEDMLPHNDFAQCRVPLTIFATNLDNLEPEIIQTGQLSSAIIASSALPFLLNSVEREGKTLIEGGFSIYYGAEYFRQQGAEVVIGADVDGFQNLKFRGHFNAIALGVSAVIKQMSKYELQLFPVDIDIRGFKDNTGMLEFSALSENLVQVGFDHTMQMMDEIKRVLFDT